MAHDEDGEIGRRIIGPLVVQRLAATRAGIANLHECPEQLAPAAGRTLARSAPHGVASRSGRNRDRHRVVNGPCHGWEDGANEPPRL